MFHKEFKVKSNSPIKGSERKRLRSEIASHYPALSPDELNHLVPNRDEMNQMKIFTHSGQVVKIYFLGPNPVFFQSENHMFPTVYTLWKHPKLLPTFSTWPPVIENLSNGADLMLPGVVLKEGTTATEKLQTIKSGDVCSICLVGNGAPIAVGTSNLSGTEIFGAERKGKAVIVAHVYGDKLWASGERSQLVQLDEERPFSDDETTKGQLEEEATNGVGRLTLDGNAVGLYGTTDEDLCSDGENADLETQGSQQECKEKTLTETMDEILMRCFLTAMKTSMKKAELPLLASTFYSAHILASCPPGDTVDIKKSSYKKVSNFLDQMHQQGFIHMQELSKGVKSIIGVNLEHEMIKRFKPEKVAPPEKSMTESDIYVPPQVKELYCISAAVLAIFKDQGASKGTAFTAGEVRHKLTEYVKVNELQIPGNPRDVRLDPLFANVLLGKDEYLETMTWEEVFSRTLSKMSKAHEILFEGKRPQFRKGVLEPINVTVAQRTGNKKVTLVYNLESYGIDPEIFAHQVQVGVAASTSVSAAPSSKHGSQVLVQGNQVRFIGKLLLGKNTVNRFTFYNTFNINALHRFDIDCKFYDIGTNIFLSDEYKLHRKYIQGLDKVPPSKKKK